MHIVKPMGFEVDDKKLKRAGLDYWHLLDITYYENIEEFFEKNKGDYYFFTTKGRKVYADVVYPDVVYLIFGREDQGLKEELLVQHPEECVRVPMIAQARSLNLSNTVALSAYEVLRQWDFPALQDEGWLTKFSWNEE